MEKTIRIFDFNVFQESCYNNDDSDSSNAEDSNKNKYLDTNQFLIQMFGIDEFTSIINSYLIYK